MSYLVEADNSVPNALLQCTGLELWRIHEIFPQLSTLEWRDLCIALNDGDSAGVDSIIGLRAFC